MPVTPFRQRAKTYSPGFLREGSGERVMYTFGTMMDCRMAKVNQGTKAHLPMVRNPYDRSLVLWVPPADCLAAQGSSLDIDRGLTESDFSYASRLQRALDSYRYAGTARGMMGQILGYLLALTPAIRVVWTAYDRSTSPPTRLSSTWQSYAAGADATLGSSNVDALAGGAGDFEWDDHNTITGSMSGWSAHVVIYSVAPNAWAQPAQAWGAGSTYTGSGDYSAVSGGKCVATGTYAGTSQAWGAGSTYTGSGDYSTVVNGRCAATGFYSGAAQAWGVNLTTDYGQSIARIIKKFKPAGAWIRAIAVPFAASRFDPADTADNIDNPNGTQGTWSLIDSGRAYGTRFTDCAFGAEVI